MAYTQHGVNSIALTSGSPSFLPNNLASFGEHLAYIRNSDVIILSTATSAGTMAGKIQGNRSIIQSISYIHVKGATYLAVSSSTGFQLWSPNGEMMTHFLALSSIYPGADGGNIHISSVSAGGNFVCAGCSTGDLLVTSLSSGGGEMDLVQKLESKETRDDSITATAASAKYCITGSENSSITAYSVADAFERLWQLNLPSGCKADPSPVTSLLIRDETVVAGFLTGHIRIYRANIGELAVEIAAHVRPVLGLSIHPRENAFASCSEDQFMAVWVLPDFESRASSVVDCICTQKFTNRMLTGVAFLPLDRLAITAYDDNEIFVLQKE